MTMHLGTRLFLQSALVLVLLVSAAPVARLPAQGGMNGKKPIAFSGHVESVDLELHTVAVKHGPIPGYMPALTNDYPVDNKVLLRLKPGDEITATVYVGDPTLHDVRVVSGTSSDKRR
jgi:Cu/Ag efflux protein CusF